MPGSIRAIPFLLLILCLTYVPDLSAQWLEFEDVSGLWLSTLGSDDEEKDIATGDLNKDGLVDIIVARKAPFSTPGALSDMLLINTGNGFEDQTQTFAPQFLTRPTDARDILIADLDGDTWLDVVVASTFEDQPVFYRNLGEGGGNWFGLADESASRLPLPLTVSPLQFCALWAGDVSGDGSPDIYFSNYDPDGNSQDVLLINDGNGVFTDETDTRLGNLRNSAFGTSVEIHDFDMDGDNDIIKISTLFAVPPFNEIGVFVLFNNGDGTFTNWQNLAEGEQPYMFTVDFIDGDGFKDIYIVDDQQDFYHTIESATPNTGVAFTTQNSTDPRTEGFGGNCKFADLDNDGMVDFGIADVDIDIPPCNSGSSLRKFSLMRNTGGILDPVYGSVVNPWNVSTYDFAFLDANDDGLMDFFMGVCDGYRLFLQSSGCNIVTQLPEVIEACQNELVALDPGGGFIQYSWSTGSTEQIITPSMSGTYCVTVTDNEGCTVEACVELVYRDFPDISLEGPADICSGEQTFLEVTTMDTALTFNWSSGQQGNPIEIFFPGTYCVTVTDSFGCTNLACVEIEESPELEPVIEGNPVICGSNPAVLSVSPEYVFASWSNGEIGLSITVEVASTYWVTVTDAAGCTGDTSVTISAQESPTVSIAGTLSFCPGTSVQLSADTGFVEYAWTNGDSTPSATIGEAGITCVVVTDTNGCTAQACVSVEEIPVNVPMITGPEVFCAGDTAHLNVSSEYVEYLWTDGATSPSTFTLVAADICVTVTDGSGCLLTDCLPIERQDVLPNLGGDIAKCDRDTVTLMTQDTFDAYAWSTGDTSMRIGVTGFGLFSVEVTDSLGCTGFDTIEITLLPNADTTLSFTFCENEPFDPDTLGGGVYQAANGCDSIVTVDIFILTNSETEVNQFVCFGDSIPDDVVEIFTDRFGCDSIVTTTSMANEEIVLTSFDVSPDGSIGTGSIEIGVGGGTGDFDYTWSTGDTGPEIMGLTRGDYSVTVTDSLGCSAVFDFFVPLGTTKPDINPGDIFTMLPNPFRSTITFAHNKSTNGIIVDRITIIDIFGRVVAEHSIPDDGQTVLPLDVPSGIYFAQICRGSEIIEVIRIVCQH